jgi:hypothetical protein
MARDILSEYGRDSGAPQRPRASHGGIMHPRDVHNYQPPQGPSSIHDHGPGLHENNCGNCGTQSSHDGYGHESGHPGLGGSRMAHGSERAIAHTNHGHGTNRKG